MIVLLTCNLVTFWRLIRIPICILNVQIINISINLQIDGSVMMNLLLACCRLVFHACSRIILGAYFPVIISSHLIFVRSLSCLLFIYITLIA